ncbi:uncharacterized protein LOC118762875 [Octopus sinensis]|uniref:Uncharacterized protein LOC118762875 n=1 Tax=Octopus sinensis TaxID=2607531 RepID=A0A7E6ERS9_9MOLL|nr:uncharacterized protein LOC118762875 [Octopus sinensis]
MNLKGMETPIQYPLILILPLALTLVFSMTPLTGESTCDEVIFKEISKSKCLIDQMKILVNTSSTEECALRCVLHLKCQYFSYCNGSCYMHRLLYDKEIKDYDCNCSSYILLSDTRK